MSQYHTIVIKKDSEGELAKAINRCIEVSDYKLVPPIQFSVCTSPRPYQKTQHFLFQYNALLLFIK